ncbi:MAG: DUF4912 domain-containing protein [Thermoanaerobacterium sp.]|nr:DUF4912 domain-containing protein [Thermoanaerobacterium sp.]
MRGFESPKIVLMIRDPLWIFCYWDIDQDNLNGETLVLKLDNITRNETTDIVIDKYANNWHIYAGYPDEEFRVRIGTIVGNRFTQIAESNTVRTPRNSPSDIYDEYFSDIFYRHINLHNEINMSSKFL